MRTATVSINGMAPLQFSKYHSEPMLEGESKKEQEARVWQARAHIDSKGRVFIPPMAFKKCFQEAAQYRGEKVQGKGQSTWTKHFRSGLLVTDPVLTGATKDDLTPLWLFTSGTPGKLNGPRVEKCFPILHEWSGEVVFHILDEAITEEQFAKVADTAGKMIGVMAFRPANGGYFGRFEIVDIAWANFE